MTAQPRLLVVTGLSGAGKSHVARTFEDMGWSVIDNLPLRLVEPLVDHRARGSANGGAVLRTVVVLDVRIPRFGDEFPPIFRRLKERSDVDASLLFVEADHEVLLRRYSETRRPHPMGESPREAIRRERRELEDVRALADSVIDTSALTVHDLRSLVIRDFAQEGEVPAMKVTVLSFGFKHGTPPSADMVFDVRFLPNPHFEPGLRDLTGEQPEVAAWLERHGEVEEFYDRLRGFVSYVVPRNAAEHKSYLTIAIGCTGGRHRSVYLANRLAKDLQSGDFPVRLFHRDAGRD